MPVLLTQLVPTRRWGLDDWYGLVEVVLFTGFVAACTARGAGMIATHPSEVASLALGTAACQVFRLRVSSIDERMAFGLSLGVLGLAFPPTDLLTTVTVWAFGVVAGTALTSRDLWAAARTGARCVLIGLTYASCWYAGSLLGAPLVVSILGATTVCLGVALMLWRLPLVVSGNGPVVRHFLPLRVLVLLVLNALLPVLAHYSEQYAYVFILTEPFRIKLIVDLTLTAAVVAGGALSWSRAATRRRLDRLVVAASELPWADATDPLQHLRDHVAAVLGVDSVGIRDEPGDGRLEISAPFQTACGETRFLVAAPNRGGAPFGAADVRVLAALAGLGQAALRAHAEADAPRVDAPAEQVAAAL